MKAIAFIMLVFMVLISTIQGKAEPVNNMSKECCHHMANMPQKHHGGQKGCDGGMCMTVLSCNNCCFLKAEPISTEVVAVSVNNKNTLPYLTGNLSDYANTCWNPPKV
ncbi:hypothetical protein SAMN05192574_11394 [Mucilaginibacter gossypiicola]|uniref:Uncharacterized protein n=1 Tax=Mucilaginibacter gossypiicola TaxID=551995 RepID=A0A1H8SPS5_9SPHI|nr:hypothetical protein [Mucilaginibacter gossypiicola]SEO80536.1 hypothetical protein SAMN05192574_11394 [Mucilaginibacter gossypiicola]